MKIGELSEKFLHDQNERLKPRTFREYESIMGWFRLYLNSYGHNHVTGLAEIPEDKPFTEYVDADYFSMSMINEFLDYFMISKAMASESELKSAGKVIKKFVKWQKENGYMSIEDYEGAVEDIDEKRDVLPKLEKAADLIYDHARMTQDLDLEETREDYFLVTRIEIETFWVESFLGDGEEFGPILATKEICSILQEGWEVYLELGKTEKGWSILESGRVRS